MGDTCSTVSHLTTKLLPIAWAFDNWNLGQSSELRLGSVYSLLRTEVFRGREEVPSIAGPAEGPAAESPPPSALCGPSVAVSHAAAWELAVSASHHPEATPLWLPIAASGAGL